MEKKSTKSTSKKKMSEENNKSKEKKVEEVETMDNLKKDNKEIKKDIKFERTLFILIILFLSLGIVIFTFMSQKEEIQQPDIPVISNDSSIQYKNFTFEKRDDGNWYTEVYVDDFVNDPRQYEVPFYYNPYEVEDIELRRGLESIFIDVPTIYITVNPDYNSRAVIAGTEISKILGKVWYKNIKAGLTKKVNGTDFPIITCDDIRQTRRVIELRLGDETKIFQEEGCIIVQGTSEEELVRAADRLSYRLLKIMSE